MNSFYIDEKSDDNVLTSSVDGTGPGTGCCVFNFLLLLNNKFKVKMYFLKLKCSKIDWKRNGT